MEADELGILYEMGTAQAFDSNSDCRTCDIQCDCDCATDCGTDCDCDCASDCGPVDCDM